MRMSSFLPPILVDLGKRKRKRLRSLERHAGPLVGEIDATVEQVRAQLGAEAEGKTLVPVVVVYKRKRRKRDDPIRILLGG